MQIDSRLDQLYFITPEVYILLLAWAIFKHYGNTYHITNVETNSIIYLIRQLDAWIDYDLAVPQAMKVVGHEATLWCPTLILLVASAWREAIYAGANTQYSWRGLSRWAYYRWHADQTLGP